MPKQAKEKEDLKDTKKEIKSVEKTNTKKSTKTKKITNITKNSNVVKTTNDKNTITKKSKSNKKEIKPTITEYYDLPQKYNETIVKVLAQTPKTLFIYWEISDSDIIKYKEQFGENFFETTKPFLIVHNDTLNYSFEVEINDFANSWYLHVNDSKSNYRIELVRHHIENKDDCILITSSNKIESPNDHILFNNSQKMVYFRNVKTNSETSKSMASLSFMKNMGKIYEIYDLYSKLYKDVDSLENLTNPSSHI